MQYPDFLKQYSLLKDKFPIPFTHSVKSEDSDFGDYLYRCNNAYFSFDNADCKNITYAFDSFKTVDCCDGDYIYNSNNLYECIDVSHDSNSTYLSYTFRTYDSHFCYTCYDSHHLFGCAFLKFKSYCIFNRQYTKEEYEKEMAKLKNKTPEEHLEQLSNLIKKYPITSTLVTHSENSDYNNHVFKSKNLYLSFDASYSEDSCYIYDSHHNQGCFDFYQTHHSQNSYECLDSDHLNSCFFIKDGGRLSECFFCEYCEDSDHLFGCALLKHKQYCILNKQYSKENYEKEVKELIESYKNINLVK